MIHLPIPKIDNSGKTQIQNQTPKQTMKNQNTFWLPQLNLNHPLSLLWLYGISTINAKSFIYIYIKYMISKHIL